MKDKLIKIARWALFIPISIIIAGAIRIIYQHFLVEMLIGNIFSIVLSAILGKSSYEFTNYIAEFFGTLLYYMAMGMACYYIIPIPEEKSKERWALISIILFSFLLLILGLLVFISGDTKGGFISQVIGTFVALCTAIYLLVSDKKLM